MRIAMIQNNVSTLGPGKRVALWVHGCSRHCEGCIAVSLNSQPPLAEIDADALALLLNMLLSQPGCTGLTISGGEPMDQAQELVRMLDRVHADDVLLYSGWHYEKIIRHEVWPRLSKRIAALIPEPYIQTLDFGSALRGSSNQPLIVLNSRYRSAYEKAASEHRRVELQQVPDGLIFAGLPPKELTSIIRKELTI